MDKLEEIFKLQKSLDNMIIEKRNLNYSNEEWIVKKISAISNELAELQDEVNWKWWKNEKDVNWKNVKLEIIDIWHFLISMSIDAGMSPDDILATYVKKHQENIDRQNGVSNKKGYDITEGNIN